MLIEIKKCLASFMKSVRLKQDKDIWKEKVNLDIYTNIPSSNML